MKLAIVGAGSSRLPLMLASVAVASRDCSLSEVALFDVRPERIDALLPAARALAAECGELPTCRAHATAAGALDGADAIIFTIRPGFEEARARDERACLDLGALGQETTGPAGFAFAARSLPALAAYCRQATASNPSCLLAIFTNPAGLVTQGLHRLGFANAVGVCDSANVAFTAVARRAGVSPTDLDFEVYGLNHLSWTRRIRSAGLDLLGPALQDEAFLAESFASFPPAQLQALGRVPVEYLYYFYRRDEALQALMSEPRSRGEALVSANRAMFADVGRLSAAGNVDEALVRYARYLADRHATYMEYARGAHAPTHGPSTVCDAIMALKGWIGGYAEVTMDLLAARSGGAKPRLMALNVPNRGALAGLEDDDVIETDCTVDATGVTARPHSDVPPEDLALVQRVKEYERLAVQAILEKSRAGAVDAMHAHPLVDSRDLAERLVETLGIL